MAEAVKVKKKSKPSKKYSRDKTKNDHDDRLDNRWDYSEVKLSSENVCKSNIQTDLLGISDRVVPEGIEVALEVADASKNTDNDGIYLADCAGSNNPIERLNEPICDENREIETNDVEIIEADSTTICEADNVIREGDTVNHEADSVIRETDTVIIEADTEICEANALICENVSSVSVETVAYEGYGSASEIENNLASEIENNFASEIENHVASEILADDSMIRGASHNINDNNVDVGISADDIVALGEGSHEMSSETSRNKSDLNRYVGDLMLESFDVQINLQNIISTDAVVSTELSSMCQTEIKRPISANRESEVKQEARTQEAVVHRRIYPALDSAEQLRPFTEEQLRTLYYNHELENIEEFIDSFIQQSEQDKHEFYEIVRSYYRARNHLSGAEHDIDVLMRDSQKYQDACWETIFEKISVSGLCQDKYKVVGDVTYERAVFNADACKDLERILKVIRNSIHDELSLYAYEAQLSRLQVESYIYKLYLENPALREIPANFPVQAYLVHQRDASVSNQVEALKQCISVLFMYQRKPAKDDVFVKDTRLWLTRLVATLLRLATLEDHLFLLNHVLRCPSGVAKWAGGLVQPVPPSRTGQMSWGGPLLDHYVTMLALVLQPVRYRTEMLQQMKVALLPTSCDNTLTENPWILVDSDGEEDEDPQNTWSYLHENDIVVLLNQFPINDIFNHILSITEDQGNMVYDIRQTTESGMLKLFAFATRLIHLMGQGLRTFNLGRYRQLNKRIGRMIRHIVQYTCDHWSYFKSIYVDLPSAKVERLQLESDMVLQRAVVCILLAPRLGSWQFLAELPYEMTSSRSIWNLLRLMHQGCYKVDTSTLQMDLSSEECMQLITDNNNLAEFLDKLTRLPTSEALFLLTTFANMARSRPNSEKDFIEVIATEIFEISYVSSHTREFCSRPGRDLLQSICLRHPTVISLLIQCTRNSMSKIGVVSHYLYRGLPLHLWQPSSSDMTTLRKWILDSEINSVENQLGRLIVEDMNWGEESSDRPTLFLNLSLHQQMAALVMDSYCKHLTGKNVGRLFIDGQKPPTPSGSKPTMNDDGQFAHWTWSVVLRLCLHNRAQPRSGHAGNNCIVDLKAEPSLQSIVYGLLSEHKYCLASYLSLVMTDLGHSSAEFCSEGVHRLSHLVEKSYFLPAIQCCFYVTPIFYSSVNCLLTNTLFMQCLETILHVDSSRKSYFSFDTTRSIASQFSAMIENQIRLSVEDGSPPDLVILFWLKLLTKLPNWQREKEIIYVVDNIIKSSYLRPDVFALVIEFFRDMTKAPSRESAGLLSSLTSWLGGNSRLAGSLFDQNICNEFTWFAYVILTVECSHLEMDTGLWKELQKKLFNQATLTIDQALAQACSSLKLEGNISPACLSIYRLAQLALDTRIDHPLLPLLWHRFITFYLGGTTFSLAQRGSVGDRFFSNSTYLTLMKKMKKRLNETAEKFAEIVKKFDSRSENASADNQQVNEDSDLSPSRRELFQKLFGLYQTLSFWLDEPRLHDASLYIPSLPPQYQPQLLASIFQNQIQPWLDFVDLELITKDLDGLAGDWFVENFKTTLVARTGQFSRADLTTSEMPGQRLLSRLVRNTNGMIQPPQTELPKSPAPELNLTLLCDQQNLLFALQSDFRTLVDHAKLYMIRTSKHLHIDCTFIELLPKLFTNVTVETSLSIPCRSLFNPGHQCKGPANITHRHESRKRDDITNRKIEECRAAYKQLVIESLLPPPQSLCASAVHVENAITCLINLNQSTNDALVKSQTTNVGTALFYSIATFVCEETKYCPCTKQFFSSCIEILGQKFIVNNPSQSQALLQTILQTPSMTGLLAPNFSPNASPELFVNMYEDTLKVPSRQGVDVAFTLLSKFDIPQWLECSRPVLSQRMRLIECISRALFQCGAEPDDSIKLVFQVYRVHLQNMLKHQFLDHFGIILKSLLQGSLSGELCTDVWNDFLFEIGCNSIESFDDGVVQQQSMHLPIDQTKEIVRFLSTYFLRLRLGSQECMNFGLYSKWRRYAKHLMLLFGHLSSNCILAASAGSNSQSNNSEYAVGELFNLVLDLFAPWIQTLDINGQILSPCIPNDIALASDIVATWLDSVEILQKSFQDRIPAFSLHALSLLWSYYVGTLTVGGLPEYMLSIYHSRLVMLPWQLFFPDIHGIELMVKVIDYPKSCFEFLGNIFPLLNWHTILQFYCTHELPEIVTRLHVCLFTLLVHLANETVIVENTSLPLLLSADDIFNWNYIDGKNYETIVSWFVDVCQPQCVIVDRTANSSQVLRLLKTAAGFYPLPPSAIVHPETPVKQCLYVRAVVRLICRCSFLKEVKQESLAVALNNLMSEIETVLAPVGDLATQHHEALVLSIECLLLLNNCNPPLAGGLLQVVMQWIESSPLSLLLMPIMTAACRHLASTVHMVSIIEACLDVHFSLDVTQTEFFGWTRVLGVLQVPDLNIDNFLQTALKEGCYLTLYSYILQRLPLSENLNDELKILNQLVDWSTSARPTSKNESKLFLWWQKIFELCIRQIDFGGEQRVVLRALLSFVPVLITLGEDKSSTGLLGAIGLGKRSTLSPRFRLVTKSMAAFLSAQMPSDSSLRLQSNVPGTPLARNTSSSAPSSVGASQQAVQTLAHLESLKTNKQYTMFRQHIELAIGFSTNPSYCLRDSKNVLKQLVSPIFPDHYYLGVVCHATQ